MQIDDLTLTLSVGKTFPRHSMLQAREILQGIVPGIAENFYG